MSFQCPRCLSSILIEDDPPTEVVCPSCGSSIPFDSGPTLSWLPASAPKRLGKFEILEQVGVGAFGAVYKARDTQLDRLVALKIPRTGNIPQGEDLERFLREGRSAAQLEHPAIVALYDAGVIDGTCCLVSEFISGATLAERLSAKRLAFRQTAELIAEMADALDYAHRQGVIHRDIKPSNIMLDLEGRPHLMDFGLAKRAADEITMTLEGQVLGTPAYMSPEQARGEAARVDARSDLYSLGVILYELLTGERPFRGQARMLLVQVMQDEPRPPRRINDQIPRDLETICLKAMAKEPARRYATARELADDLRRFLKGEPIQARPVGRLQRAGRWCRRNPTVTASVGVGVLSLVALAVVSTIFAVQERNNATALTALNTQLEDRSASLEYHGRATIDLTIGWAVLQLRRDEPIRPSELRQLRKALDLLADAPPEFLSFQQLRVLVGALHGVFPRQAFTSVAASDKEQILHQTIRLWQRFLSVNPEPGAQHEVANAYYWLGVFYRDTSQSARQREAWLKSAATSEAAAPHSNSDLQYGYASNLGRTYFNLGVLAQLESKDGELIDSMTKAIAVLKPLIAAKPQEDAKWFFLESHVGRGLGLLRQERYEEALHDAQEALTLASGERRQEIRLYLLARAQAACGEYEPALKEGEAAVSSLDRSGPNLFALAELYGMATRHDAKHAARALALLREAQQAGYFQDLAGREALRESKTLGAAARTQRELRQFLEEVSATPSPPQAPKDQEP